MRWKRPRIIGRTPPRLSVGALSAGLILESRGLLPAKPKSAFILVIIWCFAIAGFAVSSNFMFSIGLLFIAGFVDLSFNSMTQTLVQLHAPPEIRGRVIGLFNMASLGMKTFAGVTVGIVGGIIGIHWSLSISAGALLAVTIILVGYSFRRNAENSG